MQKYLLKSLIFVWVTTFGSDLFAHLNIIKCLRAVGDYDLPEALQKIEASNIQITNVSQQHSAITDWYDVYEFSFPIGEEIYRLQVGIEKPKSISESNEVSHQVTLRRLRVIIGMLPKGAFQKKLTLIIRRRSHIFRVRYKNGVEKIHEANGSVAWTGSVINLYPPLRLLTAEHYFLNTLDTMRHELGHTLDLKIGSFPIDFSISHSQRWKDAILADGHSVSEYGNTKLEEDFSEAMLTYMKTNGGLYHPHILDSFSHRFAILDEVMGVEPFERSQINEVTYSLNDWTDL